MEYENTLRLDKWLWVSRFFTTRALATAAIKGGHIKMITSSSQRKSVKPAAIVKTGDLLEIQKGAFQYIIEIKGVLTHRQPAKIAQNLYTESAESVKRREEVAAQMRAQPKNPFGGKKPDKHTLRKNRAIKRGL